MKKVLKLSLVLSILIMMCLSIFNVSNASSCNVSLQPEKSSFTKDDEIVVNVNISNIQSDLGVIAFSATLEYDRDSLKYERMERTEAWDTPSYNEENGKFAITRGGVGKSDETVIKVIFSVKEGSKENPSVSLKDVEVSDGTLISVGNVSTNVTIKENIVEPENPTDPSNPSTPTEPTDPSNPSTPTEPTDPSNPSTPTEPTEPSNPSAPTEPTDPSNPSTPTDPTDPSNPSTPTEPTDPSNPSTPTEPTDPSNPSTPTEPTDPSNSNNVTDEANNSNVATLNENQITNVSTNKENVINGTLPKTGEGDAFVAVIIGVSVICSVIFFIKMIKNGKEI